MWGLPIQNQSKLSIAKKRRNKPRYLMWNSIRLKFVKKIFQTLSKALDVSSATAQVAPDMLKAPAILSDTIVRGSAVNQEDLKPYWKSDKRPYFSRWSRILLSTIIYKVFKDFTNHRKKTNRAAVFSCRPFSNILKYRDHWWDLPTIWKTRLLQTHIEEFS